MTRTLILMRHAKSSRDNPGLGDHARPLNGRGKRSSKALGDWIRQQGWMPDQVLSSSSVRTRETFAGLDLPVDAEFTKSLYHAGTADLQLVLEMATGSTVLLLGHNPGIAEFAAEMVTSPPNHGRFHDYPTGATTVIQFDIDDWDRVEPGTGEILDFVVPRELPGV